MKELDIMLRVLDSRPNARAKRKPDHAWVIVDADGSELSRTYCGRHAAWEFALKRLKQQAKQETTP